MSKLYCTYKNHAAISKRIINGKKQQDKTNNKKIKQKNKQQQNKQKQQQHITASVYIRGGNTIMQLFWMINR